MCDRRRALVAGKRSTVLTEHAYVNVLTRGDLSSLRWIESPLRYFSPAAHSNKELCSVYYTSLNFRDIMLATGKLPPDAIPGAWRRPLVSAERSSIVIDDRLKPHIA